MMLHEGINGGGIGDIEGRDGGIRAVRSSDIGEEPRMLQMRSSLQLHLISQLSAGTSDEDGDPTPLPLPREGSRII